MPNVITAANLLSLKFRLSYFQDEKTLCWQPGQYEINKDETVDCSNFEATSDCDNYLALSQSPARRNSEEDYDSPGRFSSNVASYADFEKLLGSKLTGMVRVGE